MMAIDGPDGALMMGGGWGWIRGGNRYQDREIWAIGGLRMVFLATGRKVLITLGEYDSSQREENQISGLV